MGLFTAAYQIGSMMEPTEEEAQAFLEEFKDLVIDIDASGIFSHNTLLSLPMFIPGLGIGWGLFSAWSTGFAFAALVLLTPELSQVPALALLYVSPFGIMELVAYSIATSRSYILIWMIIKKTDLRTAVRGTIIEIGILVGLLFVGGLLENYMIELAGERGFDFG